MRLDIEGQVAYSGCMEQRSVREILDVLDVSAAYVGVMADEVPGAFALGVYQDLCDDLSELRSAYELERRAAGRLSRPIPSDLPVQTFNFHPGYGRERAL